MRRRWRAGFPRCSQRQHNVWRGPICGVCVMASPKENVEAQVHARGRLARSPDAPDSLSENGCYERLRTLGRGSFGYVVLARDVSTEEVVAIKLMPREQACSAVACMLQASPVLDYCAHMQWARTCIRMHTQTHMYKHTHTHTHLSLIHN